MSFGVPAKPGIAKDLVEANGIGMRKAVADFIDSISVENLSSLQCYSVLSDILVKNELCIPLERGSNVLSTGEGFICLSPPSKRKIAVRFCSIYKKTISFSAIVF